LKDAAQGESFNHAIFNTPFKLSFDWKTVKTPSSYLKYKPDNVELGETMRIWFVQKSGKHSCGAVSRPIRGIDRVDAESILLGFAPGKAYDATAVSRHGSFLQYGYGASPSQMTETGKRLFINCIVYIAGFNGKTPLIYHRASNTEASNALMKT